MKPTELANANYEFVDLTLPEICPYSTVFKDKFLTTAEIMYLKPERQSLFGNFLLPKNTSSLLK